MTHEEARQMFEELDRANEQLARDVDALLAASCSRLLRAAGLLNHMRLAHKQGRIEEFWRVSLQMNEHCVIASQSVMAAYEALLKAGVAQQQATPKGGLLN